MADKKATLILEIKDFFSSKLGNLATQLAVLRQGFLAITGVVNSVVGVFQSLLTEYGKQEVAINKLENALKNQGVTSKAATDDLINFANELQSTTTIADDAAVEAMALGTTFGLVGEDLKRTTKAAADMSAAMGIDLKTTMLLLGKAAVGETSTLSRYGVTIAESIPKAQRFEEVLKQLNSRFGGAAVAEANTYAGRVQQLANTFGDLKENLGQLLVGPATAFLTWAKEATQYVNALFNKSEIAGVQKRIAVLEKEKEALYISQAAHSRYGVEVGAQVEKDKASVAAIDEKISALKRQEAELKKSPLLGGGIAPIDPEEEAKRAEKKKKLIEDSQEEIDRAFYTQEQLNLIKAEGRARELEAIGQHDMAKQIRDNANLAYEKQINAQRVANMRSTLGTIATLSTQNNKTLAAIGKAAAISTATIDTYAAANKALASAPPPFNFALAALVTAAGLANVAQISGMKLAEGGMVMPRSGGVPAIMGEVGKAEVAIPLDDERTKEKLQETLGGGGTTIIIQAGTIVADEYSLDQFAQKIDQKLYGLQRNRRSNL